MIKVTLIGGLGNQMFQYAAARSLALKKKENLLIDVSQFDVSIETNRNYSLDNLNIPSTIMTVGHNWMSRLFLTLISKYRLFYTITDMESGYQKLEVANYRNISLRGHWQSPKYFESYSKVIKQELRAKINLLYPSYITSILSTYPTTSIHVRRGDYVTSKLANKLLGNLSLTYYKNAISIIDKLESNMKYIIISDDIDWCRANFSKIISPTSLTFYSEDELHDLHLMTLTNHNIIANSTFSWWGAYLNNHSNQVVVCPKTWYRSSNKSFKDLLPNHWIKV